MNDHKNAPEVEHLNFIEQMVEEDIRTGKHAGRVHTRFPPEPNGYLHIGHSKSICLNFGLADKYKGKTNLRFDDTNPEKEEQEYVNSIKEDIRWLGFEWENEFYASDYFEKIYEFAVTLIKKGLAYVDDQSAEVIASQKGTPTEAGKASPFRDRSIEENLDLFARMHAGEFGEGSRVLRAKIDMASPNMHLRDPLMYRIKFDHHHRTGDKWKIYPMYDFAHGQSDSIENITHSICTLEFEVHRPLYEWYIKQLGIFPSQQIEFARLNLNYTVMSKRKLLRLVNEKFVSGWDDPRMPTISGFRRRGFTPESIRDFAEKVGVARRENVIDVAVLEFCLREHLNRIAQRRMVVLDPLKVVITNYPDGKSEKLTAENLPGEDHSLYREMSFSKEIYIEREDYMENPSPGYNRFFPGGMVRLKHAFILKCDEAIKNNDGSVKELHCTYFPESRSGQDKSGIKVKGVIHFVNAVDAIDVEVRMYDRLFNVEAPDSGEEDFTKYLNPDSLKVIAQAKAEPSLGNSIPGDKFQFLRMGYFCADKESSRSKLIFNRTVTLKDAWAKESQAAVGSR